MALGARIAGPRGPGTCVLNDGDLNYLGGGAWAAEPADINGVSFYLVTNRVWLAIRPEFCESRGTGFECGPWATWKFVEAYGVSTGWLYCGLILFVCFIFHLDKEWLE